MSNSAANKVEVSDNVHKDFLSNLPECVILHILSFLTTKHAVTTCILSSTWKDLWKRLPVLSFGFSDFLGFPTNKIFTEFVSKVLSLRDSSASLHTLHFENRSCLLDPHLLTCIVNYALSHNVQRLRLSVTSVIAQVPLALFSSHTLTHLTLTIPNHEFEQISLNLPSLTYLMLSINSGFRIMFPKSLNLPALSTLKLVKFTFSVGDNDCAEPFSTFNRLNCLLVSDCTVEDWGTLCISSSTLVNFIMFNDLDDNYKIDLCTPSLCQFAFRGIPNQDIYGSDISSLKHVDIDVELFPYTCCGPPLFLFNWLSQFANIKSLTVTAATLKVLLLIPGLLKRKISSLGKLKSLKVKIEEFRFGHGPRLCSDKLHNVKSKKEAARIRKAFDKLQNAKSKKEAVTRQKTFDLGSELSLFVPDGIVNFLLQNSPSAEVDLVDCRKKPHRRRHL